MRKIFFIILLMLQGCNPGDSITKVMLESTKKKFQIGTVSDLEELSYEFICEFPGQQSGWQILVEGNPFVKQGAYENDVLNNVDVRIYAKNLSTHVVESLYSGEKRKVMAPQKEVLLYDKSMGKIFYDSMCLSGIWIFTKNKDSKIKIRFEFKESAELVRPIKLSAFCSDNI